MRWMHLEVKNRTIVFVLVGLFASNLLFAGNGKTDIDLERANAYFLKGYFHLAAKHYEFSNRKKSNPFALEKLSDCYVKLSDFKKAELALYKLNRNFHLNQSQSLKYGYLLKHNGKIEQLKTEFLNFIKLDSSSASVYLPYLASCDSMIKWAKDIPNYLIFNMEEINTPYSEISPVNYNDSLVFASNREGSLIKRKSPHDNQPFFDIFVASLDYRWKAGKPKRMHPNINSLFHESSASFISNGNKIYFSRCSEDGFDKDSIKRVKLYASEKINNQWIKPHTFILNDSCYSFAHPCIEKNEKMIFFASDMKGGYGGTDIYVSVQVEDSIWSDPINLGPIINSPGNENYPFYHEDGNLYFASDYHVGMGGYDIFVAFQKNGNYTSISNLKPPINSSYDDIGFFFNSDQSFGYLSSNRSGGKGKEDIYLIRKK